MGNLTPDTQESVRAGGGCWRGRSNGIKWRDMWSREKARYTAFESTRFVLTRVLRSPHNITDMLCKKSRTYVG